VHREKGELMQLISSPGRTLFAAIAILAIGALVVTLGTLRRTATGDSEPTEIELITLRPAGFEPAEITRPKGPFVLFIDDRSGRENSSLALHRSNGGQLRAIGLQRKKTEWSDVVDLTPGTYILQDANNSELQCQITILP
jgi:hypothetical protein